MVRWLMRRGIAAFERQWKYDASYVHDIIDAMGHGKTCSRIVVGGAPMVFDGAAVSAQRG